MTSHRPFASYLVERMKTELVKRKEEYLEDRLRAETRLTEFVRPLHEELFLYRTRPKAHELLIEVEKILNELGKERERLERKKRAIQA